jgi:hypothetical protein
LGSEFDGFLFAPIGPDRNGMLLSVLSALARLDVDPWQEAAHLAGMPQKLATGRLTSMIAALPAGSPEHGDPQTIAARLVALLPRQRGTVVPSRETILGLGAMPKLQPAICVIVCMAVVAFALAGQLVAENRLQRGQGVDGHASAPVAAPARAAPAGAD